MRVMFGNLIIFLLNIPVEYYNQNEDQNNFQQGLKVLHYGTSDSWIEFGKQIFKSSCSDQANKSIES